MVKEFIIKSASHCSPNNVDKLRFETTNGNVVFINKSQIDKKLMTNTHMVNDHFWEGIKLSVDFYDPGETIPGPKPYEVKEGQLINRPMAFSFITDTVQTKQAFKEFNDEVRTLKLAGVTFVSHKHTNITVSADDEPELPAMNPTPDNVAGNDDDLPF